LADDQIQGGETAYYRALITQYDKAAKPWETRAKKIIKRYLDERPDGQVGTMRYNILWSNVETLKPAIYAHTPKPEVERRFLDKDPVGRMASQVLERCIAYFVSTTAFGSTMRQSRDDYLLVGRGISWVRYEPKFKSLQVTDDAPPADPSDPVSDANESSPEEPDETIDYEDVVTDYVHWKDFGHNVARTWEEVSVGWRIVYMTREELKARKFRDWLEIPLDYTEKELKDLAGDDGKKATVYEVWDKAKRKVCWIAKSWPKYLDERADPLKLDHFFPFSRPIYATLANESLIPVPDYAEYQDQASEIDGLTGRIAAMQKALKAAGVYDASQPEVGRLLSEGVDNKLIPVASWAALNEKGGLANAIQMLPMQEVAQTLLALYEARDKAKADLYEITGMSDIIRGATNPNETATAQTIKSNFVTLRLSEKQREMQRFARNTIEIMGNVIARHFTDKTIKQISGIKMLTMAEKQQASMQMQQQMAQWQQAAQQAQQGQQQPPPQPQMPNDLQDMMNEPSWDEVLDLLRDTPDRSFRIGIETDSTIDSDRQQEQEGRVQFLQAVGGFIQNIEGAAATPELAPLLGEMLAFGVRGFKVGRELEGVIDSTIEKMTKQAANPPAPQPNPEMMKLQQDGQLQQAKMQGDQAHQKMMLEANQSSEAAKLQSAQQIESLKATLAHQAAQDKAQRDSDAEVTRAESTMQIEHMKAGMAVQIEREKMAMQGENDRWKAEKDAETKILVAEIAAQATVTTAQANAAQAAAQDKPVADEKPANDNAEHIKAAIEEMKRPRKVVRGSDGKITGIE
jgi:hypothetical protein